MDPNVNMNSLVQPSPRSFVIAEQVDQESSEDVVSLQSVNELMQKAAERKYMARALKKYPLPEGRLGSHGGGQAQPLRESQLGNALLGYVGQVQQRKNSKSRSPSRRM